MSDTATINQKVLVWARGKKGQQVGRGECWDLAHRALHQAGARSSTTSGDDDDYVWGEPIALKDVKGGDILQIRDLVTKVRVETTVEFADGGKTSSWKEDGPHMRPHHTAIVDRVLANGDLVILEQHVKPLGKKVQLHVLQTRSRTPPTKITNVTKRDSNGRMQLVKVYERTTVTVTGKIWAYRPRPR